MISWKRKTPSKLSNQLKAFDDSEQLSDDDSFPPCEPKRPKSTSQKPEESNSRQERAKTIADQAISLAENEQFEKALPIFEQSLLLYPDVKIFEMHAQVLNELGQHFAAIEACEKAYKLDPTWYVLLQTLARSQLNFGEVKLALKSVERAVHLKPDEKDLWKEMNEFRRLLQKANEVEQATKNDENN